MPFSPLTPPYWTVPSWNPDVNQARAAGEYPTAGWANQLQALHDQEVAKINELGADLDAVSVSAGVVAGTHAAGSVFVSGGDGLITALSPGTSLQVLSWDANTPDVAVKVDVLTSPWTALTLNGSMVDISGANGVDQLKVRVHDRRVEIVGAFDTAALTGAQTVATLAPAFRPPVTRPIIGHTSGSTNMYSSITSSSARAKAHVTSAGLLVVDAVTAARYWWFQTSYPLD